MFGTAIFAVCVVVALIFVYFAAFAKARAQSAAPSPFSRQEKALGEMVTAAGIVSGVKYTAGGTNYVIKEVTIAFTRNGNHTIEIRSEVVK
jgi:hypothetical protein